MKIKHLFTICIITMLVIPQISCKKDWAAKIDGETISMEDFNKFYYLQSKMMTNIESNEEIDKLAENPAYANHPLLSKAGFLDHIIAQKLLYKKAMDDKAIDHNELDTVIEMIKIQTVAQYYLGKKLKDKITVSDEEVNSVYNQNKAKFVGRTADEATAYIKQQIFAQKSRQETNKYIMELIAESKVDKEGFKNAQSKTVKAPAAEVKP
ncbi:MAG TPA: hypothetical protein PKG60_09380 [Spirochaetota bacterium]|jgi:hypothetical protein|nr:hypothetical protein [Spirochaetota bacterium]HPS86801.1 hypothetical protein [Spirochaetota bacterium]